MTHCDVTKLGQHETRHFEDDEPINFSLSFNGHGHTCIYVDPSLYPTSGAHTSDARQSDEGSKFEFTILIICCKMAGLTWLESVFLVKK